MLLQPEQTSQNVYCSRLGLLLRITVITSSRTALVGELGLTGSPMLDASRDLECPAGSVRYLLPCQPGIPLAHKFNRIECLLEIDCARPKWQAILMHLL